MSTKQMVGTATAAAAAAAAAAQCVESNLSISDGGLRGVVSWRQQDEH